MATRQKTRMSLPEVGAVYQIPLLDGRFGACRILQRRERSGRNAAYVLAGACEWVGDMPLDVPDERLRPLLVLTHHAHRSAPALIWIDDAVPKNFMPIGLLLPTESDAKTPCTGYSSWLWLQGQITLQRRWDNERETLLREEAEEAAAKAALALANRAENETRAQHKKDAMTLQSLHARTTLDDWRGMVPARKIKATRAILEKALDDLSALGASPKLRPVLRILRQCVLSLNEIDAPHPFIETTEREELCELIDDMAYVVGIRSSSEDSLCDRWREW